MKRLVTAADIRDYIRCGETHIDLGPDDLVTAEAEDVATNAGISLVRATGMAAVEQARVQAHAPRGDKRTVKVVRGGQVPMEPFAFDVKRPDMNICTTDVVTDSDGSPMGAGFMSMEQGSFPWTLNYDEIDIVLEGELVIQVGDESYSGHAGDVIYIPRGASIRFATPTRCRFVYVTYPANWNAQ
ncbi:MAG: cupin domain-containing protein [Anaerolineae bacterium]